MKYLSIFSKDHNLTIKLINNFIHTFMQIERLKREKEKCSYRFGVTQDVGNSRVELREYGRYIYTMKANVC